MAAPTQGSLTIGELAAAASVPTSTVRFYERRGLIKPEARTAANYRAYSNRSAEKLKFIRAAHDNGFSLKDIAQMLTLAYAADPPCTEVAALIGHRLGEVRERLRALRQIERALTHSMKSCCRKDAADWCSRVQRLEGREVRP
jgi:MerR family mercuric resistance operon transcriptional regulator